MKGGTELGKDYELTSGAPTIAWKTGTSHGFRDAWAVGIHGDHVLAVSMGNFSGRGNNALIARRTAVPLLFDLLTRFDLPSHPRPAPAGVRHIEACPQSGCLPGTHCPHHAPSWFIPGVSPIKPCELHREILVDADTGLRLARDDGRASLRREVHEF